MELKSGVTMPNRKLNLIVDNMRKISKQIEARVETINADVITTRKDPEIVRLWNKLCILHLRGLLLLEKYEKSNPELCEIIKEPQACIAFLHLTEEETCCNRYLKRQREQNNAKV